LRTLNLARVWAGRSWGPLMRRGTVLHISCN
jgi:hypothetical protein